jgi:hypothetical protein
MSNTFRPWKIDEPLLLPVTVADFVAESHVARFVLSVVREGADLSRSPALMAASGASRRLIRR